MRLRFVFHAAEHAALPVPEALAARIVRQVRVIYSYIHICIWKDRQIDGWTDGAPVCLPRR